MTTIVFTKDAARDLARAYATPDMIAQRETVLKLLGLQSGERIIDIGCGPGFLCASMAERVGPSGAVLGIDISADLIAMCRDRDPPDHLSYAEADALSLPCPDGDFDVAVCTQVAEYIPDTAKVLSEMFRVLRPGGRALVMATDWGCIGWNCEDTDRMARVMDVWDGHCAHPTLPRVLAARLTGAGFARPNVQAHPLINLSFDREKYSFGIAKLMRTYIKSAGFDPVEADAWFDELGSLDADGRYYFSSSRMIFCAEKPG